MTQISFLDKDFYSLQIDQKRYQKHYESDSSCFSKYFAMFFSLQYLLYLKQKVNNAFAINKQITDDDLKNIKLQQSSQHLSKRFGEQFIKAISQLKEDEEINHKIIMKTIIRVFKGQITLVILFSIFDSCLRISISVIILYLFNSVSDGQSTKSYILSAAICIIWYFLQSLRQQGVVYSYILSARIKSGLLMLLYGKVSSLTSYTMKSAQLGKITNLLSSDFSVLQSRLSNLFQTMSFPFIIVGSSALLVTRLGWPGIIGIIIILLLIPLASCISKRNGNLIREINIHKDKRVQITTQVIEGIKFVKLYGWEIAFRKIIQGYRVKQIENYKKLCFGRGLERGLAIFIVVFSGLIMYIVAHYSGQELTFPKIFSSLQVIFSFKIAMIIVAYGLGVYFDMIVVFDRFSSIFKMKNKKMIKIDQSTKMPYEKQENQKEKSKGININEKNDFSMIQLLVNPNLSEQEINVRSISENTQGLERGTINFHDFMGYWKEDKQVASLKKINYTFKKGVLYGISGKVGSGKSGLIGVILGQIPYYSGHFSYNGKLAYVEQEPIIFSDTVRNNITFGKQFREDLYNQVISQSCLIPDFKILEHGDQTLIGQKGVTLSGGQKARVALARALYSQADIFLLDDPISAVDSKVAKEIHQKCLKKLVKSKTVILVTHQIPFLYDCDEVILMEDGAIIKSGKPSQLSNQLKEMSSAEDHSKQAKQQNQQQEETLLYKDEKNMQPSQASQQSQATQTKQQRQIKKIKNTLSFRLAENEVKVNFSSYTKYISSSTKNYILFPITILLFILNQVLHSLFLRYLANYDLVKTNQPNLFGNNFALLWGILGVITFLYFIVLIIKYYLLQLTLLNSNQNLHEQMINGIVRSPCEFFDVTPSGVIINKFSNDLGILDNALAGSFIDMLQGPIAIISAMINVCQLYYLFIPAVVVFATISIMFFVYSKPVIVQSKQMDLKNKNPIYHFFGESMNGLVQINTYGRRKDHINKLSHFVNKSTKASVAFDIITRGFGFYQTVIALILMLIGVMVGVYQSQSSNSGLYGVSVIYLISYCELFQWILRQIITAQSQMISYERAKLITELPSEKELRTEYDCDIGLKEEVDAAAEGEQLSLVWPQNPSVQFSNLSARYKEGLPRVLKDVSFIAKAGQRIGIVGRTGAGKSSIIQTLFRLIEPELGSKLQIGGYDALKMGLHSLRQHLSVIPQTPFLFKGTVKQNIDPFSTSKQDDLWRVLAEAGLAQHVKTLPQQLQTNVSNASQSFSVGQKQLLCLSRALLRRSKILILDEATSNVDMETDSFIQTVIKQKFKNTTVITVAHRLNTIADYDTIIVMKRGRIVEIGTPYDLIQRNGLFTEMVQHTGKNAALITAKARQKQQSNNKMQHK